MTAQRAASTGELLRATLEAEKFHGVMVPTTPIGCLTASMRWPVEGREIVSHRWLWPLRAPHCRSQAA